MRTVKTPYGEFHVYRKDAVAISVVKITRSIIQRRAKVVVGQYSTVEHLALPIPAIKSYASWADFVAAYDLNGTPIPLTGKPMSSSFDILLSTFDTHYAPLVADERLNMHMRLLIGAMHNANHRLPSADKIFEGDGVNHDPDVQRAENRLRNHLTGGKS